jgi:DHA1 family bicyclomycin/chloramphenicol resistance-like MFS transporter
MARTLSLTTYSVILGLVAAVGPFAIDMYLPAMPAIGADLEATMQGVQWTIVACPPSAPMEQFSMIA